MSFAVKTENVSKHYRIGSKQSNNYPTLRDALVGLAKNITGGSKADPESTLWALTDVSFEIQHGEVVGLVGKNGSGKSTLLKILSRITDPSKGNIAYRGRLASLLEVGTGFHAELTGRENIFLNGIILGMKRAEVLKKFDQIVEFSGVERFLDTPVKRYSSGMYMRLAFSVAAHLDPDILVVDEVLSVGDVAFQKKCTGAMKEVAGENRTVLFVSHNLEMLRSICHRGLLLDQGNLVLDSRIETVLTAYIKSIQAPHNVGKLGMAARNRYGSGLARFESINCLSNEGIPSWSYYVSDSMRFQLGYQVVNKIPNLCLYYQIYSVVSGETISADRHIVRETGLEEGEKGIIELTIPELILKPGDYGFRFGLGGIDTSIGWHDWIGEHTDVPILTVLSHEGDIQKDQGYFALPTELTVL